MQRSNNANSQNTISTRITTILTKLIIPFEIVGKQKNKHTWTAQHEKEKKKNFSNRHSIQKLYFFNDATKQKYFLKNRNIHVHTLQRIPNDYKKTTTKKRKE